MSHNFHSSNMELPHIKGGENVPNRVSLSQAVAIFIALISGFGAFIGYQSALMLSRAILYKNDAIIRKTEAFDNWNHFQSKKVRSHIDELALLIAPASQKKFYQDRLQRYKNEETMLQSEARKSEIDAKSANQMSMDLMEPFHNLELCMMMLQISIALASIAVLTHKLWLFYLGGFSAVIGIFFAIMAFI